MNIQFYIIYCLLLYVFAVNASYDISDSLYSQLQMRGYPGTFSINGTLYMLGGYAPGLKEMRKLKQFTSISFNDIDGTVQYSDLTREDTPIVAESYPVVIDNNRVLMIGGYCDMELNTACNNGTLFIAEYRFDNQAWTLPRVPNVNVTADLPHQTVSASVANDGLVYLRYNHAAGMSFLPELWSFNPTTYEMENLTRTVPDQPAFDNAAYLSLKLPNGELAFIAEDMQANYSVNTLLLYNPTSQYWRVHDLQGEATPYDNELYKMVSDPSAAKIYFFGGRARNLPHGSFNDMKVLDTTTWTWENVEAVGTPPGGRFNPAMAFIDNNLLVITSGSGDYFWFNDINVIRLADGITPHWITNITEPVYIPPDSNEHSVSRATIIGSTIGGVAVLVILILVIVFRKRVMRMAGRAFRLWLWSPRMGEPLWTELWRFGIKTVLIVATILILAVSISNILNSPVVNISFIEDVSEVPVPDVRVCLDGVALGFVGCLTDTISPQRCNDLGIIRPLNMSIHRPFLTQGTGEVSCFLFSPPESFHLSTPESQQLVNNNGTRVTLRIGYIPSIPNVAPYVYISLYPQGRDPNLVKYFNETQDLTDDRMALWLNQERSDIHASNHYSIGIETFSTISYQHEAKQTLAATNWNRIGFFSSYNNSFELNTEFSGSPIDPTTIVNGNDEVMQIVTLNPKDFISVRTRQQKLHTVVSVLGIVGGALSLFSALLVLLFGTRPASPWGFVQQLSFGKAKRSLLYRLQDSFHPWASRPVPFVDFTTPLQHEPEYRADKIIDMPSSSNPFDGDASQDTKQRLLDNMKKMEDMNRRLQLMEVVFKYYYIDPEVFNRISRAMDKESQRGEQSTIDGDDRSLLTSPSLLHDEDTLQGTERSWFTLLMSRLGIVKLNKDVQKEDNGESASKLKKSSSKYSQLEQNSEFSRQ